MTANKSDSLAASGGGLDDAFGDDSSFTETMTGIVSTVTRSISSKKKEHEPKKEAPTQAPAVKGDSDDTSFGVAGWYTVTGNLALGLGADFGDDISSFGVGFRLYFDK